MKPHGVIIKPARKRVRPRHFGPATLKPRRTVTGPPTASTAVVGVRELQLARALSDTEAEARDAALQALHAWLAAHAADVSTADMDKLCKALFYCVWMADTRPVITQVVRRVVGLSAVAGWPFLSALLRCVVREWHGVDRHRVDKYYELVTEAVEACVARCQAEAAGTGPGLVAAMDALIGVLDTEVLAKAAKGASGVALHVLDYWTPRVLAPVLAQAAAVLPQNDVVKIFETAMRPVYAVLAATSGTLMAVSRRAVDRVCTPLPETLAAFGLSDKAQRDMARRTMKKLWEAASNKDTVESCRAALYAAHATLKAHATELETRGGVLPVAPTKPAKPAAQQAADAMEMGETGEPDTVVDTVSGKAPKVPKTPKTPKTVKGKATEQTPATRRRTRQAIKEGLDAAKVSMEVEAIVADADPFAK